MNNDIAIFVAPLGCYTRSGGSASFQRETQSYARDPVQTPKLHERKCLVRMILSLRRLTLDLDSHIRAHLRKYDLRDVWDKLGDDRRRAASEGLYERVHATATGRANGMASFTFQELHG